MKRSAVAAVTVVLAMAPAVGADLQSKQVQAKAVSIFPRLVPVPTLGCTSLSTETLRCDALNGTYDLEAQDQAKMLQLQQVTGVTDESHCVQFFKKARPTAKQVGGVRAEGRIAPTKKRTFTDGREVIFDVSWATGAMGRRCWITACSLSTSPTPACEKLFSEQ